MYTTTELAAVLALDACICYVMYSLIASFIAVDLHMSSSLFSLTFFLSIFLVLMYNAYECFSTCLCVEHRILIALLHGIHVCALQSCVWRVVGRVSSRLRSQQ